MIDECLTADDDVENFTTFDYELETHQNYDSMFFLEEKRILNVENNDNDASDTSD